jgi:hypothetical protein
MGMEGTEVTEPIVLLNKQVDGRAVEKAFETLQRRVQGRPEDTVVVFLAGHATVRREQFCLLLPDAELPDRPLDRDALVFRGPVENPPSTLSPARDPTVLPYFYVHSQLAFIDALKRLVIIDACEAEAIYDVIGDRGSPRREFHRRVNELSRRARTSYILATRRGERAAEPSELGHGLLTYSLLRGMGDTNLLQPPGLEIFRKYPSADLDGDGWIQADELRKYAGQTVPALTDRFPGPARGNAARAISEPRASIDSDVDASAGFPLIRAPQNPPQSVR